MFFHKEEMKNAHFGSFFIRKIKKKNFKETHLMIVPARTELPNQILLKDKAESTEMLAALGHDSRFLLKSKIYFWIYVISCEVTC